MSDINEFISNGFVLKKKLFSNEEINKLNQYIAIRKDKEESARETNTSTGKLTMTMWNHPSEDLFGKFSTNERIVKPMEIFLNDEVYHYHSKIIWKNPGDGGFDWHQDYGYWYHYGCLRPMMASAMIAVDPAKLSNGCLEVLKGSHHLGRLDHSLAGDQSGADPERVKVALEQFERVAVELEPGDTLFFHCNLLHCSGQNHSPQPRWAMICCYNAASNNPYKTSRHPQYTPLEQVDDTLIKMVGLKRFSEIGGIDFMGEKVDRNIPSDLHKPLTKTI